MTFKPQKKREKKKQYTLRYDVAVGNAVEEFRGCAVAVHVVLAQTSLSKNNNLLILIREAAKKVIFLVDSPLRRGVKSCSLRKNKKFFFFFIQICNRSFDH